MNDLRPIPRNWTFRINSKGAASGFTLIELMIVVAVFVALSVLAIPSIRGMVDNMSSHRAVHEIISDLHVARTLAIRHSRPATVQFDVPANDQYTVTWNVPQQSKVVDISSFRHGVHFEQNPPGGASPPPVAQITFNPQGFATAGGDIYLTDQDNAEVTRIEISFAGAISEMHWDANINQWIYK